jgi:hypothetical protein
MTSHGGAASVVAEIRELVGSWTHPEQFAQKLRLELRPSAGAALALLDNVLVWDLSLPSDEDARLLARGCARYLMREGAACSEAALADEILLASRAHARNACAV